MPGLVVAPAAEPQAPNWAALPSLVLSLVFSKLSQLLQAAGDEFLDLGEAELAAGGAACCRHWAAVACTDVSARGQPCLAGLCLFDAATAVDSQ